MTPQQFIEKWQHNTLTERAGAQAHFLDLRELLGVDKPGDADNYCFERSKRIKVWPVQYAAIAVWLRFRLRRTRPLPSSSRKHADLRPEFA